MAKLFGVNIAALLNKELAPGLLRGRVIYDQGVVRDSSDPTAGLFASSTSVATYRGIANTYTDKEIDGELVLKEDRKFLIIAESLRPAIVPVTGMKIELDETPGTWFIVRVTRDPASATYICQSRL
jgi:hypothetical protein